MSMIPNCLICCFPSTRFSIRLPVFFLTFFSLVFSSWLLTSTALTSTAFASTTGKLSGRVTDKATRDGLPGVSVVLAGTRFGAATDADGYYNLINVPPGKYDVRISIVGYRTFVVKGIQISADKTTKQDAALDEAQIAGETVTVTAERPVIETNLTSSVATITAEDIQLLPVQELKDIVNLQAGVVDGHFRGGRLGEVQYLVNGVSINNPFNNSASLQIDRSLLQEVQVISGTFDAEYGQANSGVVSTVLKSGGDQLIFGAEIFQGGYIVPATGGLNNAGRVLNYNLTPTGLQNYQLNVSGPVGLPQTYFLFSGRRYENNGYLFGSRTFVPTDRSDFSQGVFRPTGDGRAVSLSFNREWSGLAQITNRSIPQVEIKYQFLLNSLEGKAYNADNRANFNYRYNPDGTKTQRTFSLVQGIDWIHTLSEKTFYNISARQNYFDFTDYAYEDILDPRYFEAGSPVRTTDYEEGVDAVLQGVDGGRFGQRTTHYIFKGAVTSQIAREHLVKAGVEFQTYQMEFGTPGGFLVNNPVTGLFEVFDVDPNTGFPAIEKYNPLSVSAFAQDQLEWNDVTVRGGVRLEYFDSRSFIPSDLANPANSIRGVPESFPKATTPKFTVSPRLGISYPIGTSAGLFFAYGHFYQMPEMGIVFRNSNYSVLKDLQAGGNSYNVLGNPNIKPEQTIQYELGYKQAITKNLGADLTIFYKDIRDLLGVEFVSTYTAAEYARYTNVDFGSVHGFTLSVDQRLIGNFSTTLDYTWQLARGNSSDPRETATAAEAGNDARPRQIPLNWDQRHTLNLTATLQNPNDFSLTAIVRLFGGTPYTPARTPGIFGGDLEANSDFRAASVLVDLRGEKTFQVLGMNTSAFFRVFNLFDTRFSNGFLFNDTGTPDYTLNTANQSALRDPSRYYPPRRIEIGISIR